MIRASRFLALALALLSAACGGGGDSSVETPGIAYGEYRCALCDMRVEDPRFSPVLLDRDDERFAFDSIECLLPWIRRHGASIESLRVWLPDYAEGGKLHRAESMTLVRADYASPMGGGYAAFKDAALAEKEAGARKGTSGGLMAFVLGNIPGNGE